jgi:hypothetical protein
VNGLVLIKRDLLDKKKEGLLEELLKNDNK